ncbi:ATPase WRNIP1 [Colossoma macropomum]|uniref:ATPase WRNIP1 n=1 Tax=Colossoma macropomum TaxID=42526 RepID=UPI001864CCA0|nr:ATPase WRNIP1 [Colossoma macropomum]
MAGKKETESVKCPVCSGDFEPSRINSHLDECLLDHQTPSGEERSSEKTPPAKKPRVSDEAGGSGGKGGVKTERPAGVFSLFHTKTKEAKATEGENEPNTTTTTTTSSSSSTSTSTSSSNCNPAMRWESLLNIDKPLAEKLRPTTLEEYFGQNKVVGEQTLLRSLLQSQEIPSLIFWGPPGCGKTTLAHIIASSSKKKGTARFVTLSATSASTNDVREVIKQAQNELRLCKRRTILFIDEIHRFNKSQQDTFLPHVECGTITLIGATTENPSFQVNSALLSRCRVLVLEKLSVAAMGSILRRAVDSLGLRVLLDDAVEQKRLTSADRCSEPQVCIEQKALDTIAHLCDGDARAGLNGLQLAVQACVAKARNTHAHTPQHILVQEVHIKEGLQRSHILYDKAGEEHYNCISALHKSMRGSDENAALYWLGRMLEGGEDPLYVARRLVRFASEDVGLADPAALPQAVAAFQACHFIGMPECEVILAQCAVYLARAPKSVEVYMAYNNVKTCLRNHKGPLPPVPLHIRNAPTKLMKELGYAKGYKYNPAFNGPVDQAYLPEELRGINFFTWKPTGL